MVAGFIVVGLVVAIAAFVVTREAGRIARNPPPALFDFEDAFEWVLAHLPDDVAATLTPDDVRRILDFQVEFFKRKGVSANGSTEYPPGTVVIGGAETVGLHPRAFRGGRRHVPPRTGARRARDAAGVPAGDRRRGRRRRARRAIRRAASPSSCGTNFGTRERRWSNTCIDVTGPWRCAAARPGLLYRWTACGV